MVNMRMPLARRSWAMGRGGLEEVAIDLGLYVSDMSSLPAVMSLPAYQISPSRLLEC